MTQNMGLTYKRVVGYGSGMKGIADMKGNQLILEGILTEGDIVRAYMRKLAAKAGKSRSPQKVEAGRRNAAKARAALAAKVAAAKVAAERGAQ